MEVLRILLLLGITLVGLCGWVPGFDHGEIPAIFTFGDSLSDAGNLQILAGSEQYFNAPYGVTLGRYTGRASDGLLTVDIITRILGMGELAVPSLGSFNSTMFKSLDFAYSGAQALPATGFFPDFPAQILEFLTYKRGVLKNNPHLEAEFGKSMYVLEFGVNDILTRLKSNMSYDSIKTTEVPKIVEGLRGGIIDLYNNGSRNFFIFNIPGLGCTPYVLARAKPGLRFDRFGCLQDVNEVVSVLNEGLRELVENLRKEFLQGRFILFDFYEAKYSILANSNNLGFKFTTQTACCGSGGAYNCSRAGHFTLCGCGELVTSACSNPSDYISWDGLHYTQHFYEVIAAYILEGSLQSNVVHMPNRYAL